MVNKVPPRSTFAALLALGLAIAPASAQQARSFVSAGFGNDANAPNCTRTSPCRTFQAAHNGTLANGEITVLDPGSYGGVTITQNISIVNDGVGEAGILVSGGGTGINVNAPAGASVTLRGITIKGIGFGGGDGIAFTSGAALNIENCTIRNLDGANLGNGIMFLPNAAAALQVTNTIVSDNAGSGIFAVGSSANAIGVLDHVGLYNNAAAGVNVVGATSPGGTITITVTDSVAGNNGAGPVVIGGGFVAQAAPGTGAVRLVLLRSASVLNPNNGIVAAGPGASVTVNQSTVFNNASGWLPETGGVITTFGNNAVIANAANEGPQTPANLK